MYKISYESMIKAIENEDTYKIIGKIDTDSIKLNSFHSLFYIFPLIEKIVLEIYKTMPLTDVEYYQQGTMRTINQLIKKSSDNPFSEELNRIINKYYKDDGLRNKIFHPKDETGTITYNNSELDYYELKKAVLELVYLLRKNYRNKESIINSLGKIELLKND